jgi:predicted transcriptional regulator
MDGKYAFVMMIQDRWWRGFLQRKQQGKITHSYVQKGLAPPKYGSAILFYVAKPVGEMAGYAELIERQAGNAEKMWDKYGHESVLKSKEQFEEFMGGRTKASFIRFKNLKKASKPISLTNLLMVLGIKKMSRKGFYVDRKTADKLTEFME